MRRKWRGAALQKQCTLRCTDRKSGRGERDGRKRDGRRGSQLPKDRVRLGAQHLVPRRRAQLLHRMPAAPVMRTAEERMVGVARKARMVAAAMARAVGSEGLALELSAPIRGTV